MKTRLLFLTFILGAFAFAFFQEGFHDLFRGGQEKFGAFRNALIERSRNPASIAESEVVAPGPLRGAQDATGGQLTEAGTVAETNAQRAKEGLATLTVNAELTAAAEAKVRDMFARQYFAHDAPDGKGVGDLAHASGYAFIAVGENLALGGFADDAALVQAWMDSPGHRANIMSTRFREIGVAVGKGMFEGRETWLAVQHFGFPRSACPEPKAEDKAQIDAYNAEIQTLNQEAAARRADLEDDDPQTQEEVDEHNRKVEEYNTLVAEINALIEDTKKLVAAYNKHVAQYNACATGG